MEFSGAWVRATRGRDDCRKENAGISFPAVRNRLPVSGSHEVWTLFPGTSQDSARVGGEPASGCISASGLEWGGTASRIAVGRGVLCSRSTLPAFLAKRGEKGAGGGRERLP